MGREERKRVLILMGLQTIDLWERGDLPLNFHPAAIRVSAGFTPYGAG